MLRCPEQKYIRTDKAGYEKESGYCFKEMETEMMKVIKNDPQSAEQLKDILTRAKERMMEDD